MFKHVLFDLVSFQVHTQYFSYTKETIDTDREEGGIGIVSSYGNDSCSAWEIETIALGGFSNKLHLKGKNMIQVPTTLTTELECFHMLLVSLYGVADKAKTTI